jgi:hypothetical protein
VGEITLSAGRTPLWTENLWSAGRLRPRPTPAANPSRWLCLGKQRGAKSFFGGELVLWPSGAPAASPPAARASGLSLRATSSSMVLAMVFGTSAVGMQETMAPRAEFCKAFTRCLSTHSNSRRNDLSKAKSSSSWERSALRHAWPVASLQFFRRVCASFLRQWERGLRWARRRGVSSGNVAFQQQVFEGPSCSASGGGASQGLRLQALLWVST